MRLHRFEALSRVGTAARIAPWESARRHPKIVAELKSEYARRFTGVHKPLAWNEAAWREQRHSL
jgi:hypothetical protein